MAEENVHDSDESSS